MNYAEVNRKLECIIEHSQTLSTLVNKKWYDEQREMLQEIDGILYHARTLKSLEALEENTVKIRNSLYKLCDTFIDCTNCPLYEKNKICLIKNEHQAEKLDAEQLGYLYDKMQTWVESFLIE